MHRVKLWSVRHQSGFCSGDFLHVPKVQHSCSAVHRGVLTLTTASEPTTGVCLGTRAVDGVRWKKKRRESEVEKARSSLVSLQLHDPNSFVPRALTDGLNGAL